MVEAGVPEVPMKQAPGISHLSRNQARAQEELHYIAARPLKASWVSKQRDRDLLAQASAHFSNGSEHHLAKRKPPATEASELASPVALVVPVFLEMASGHESVRSLLE